MQLRALVAGGKETLQLHHTCFEPKSKAETKTKTKTAMVGIEFQIKLDERVDGQFLPQRPAWARSVRLSSIQYLQS